MSASTDDPTDVPPKIPPCPACRTGSFKRLLDTPVPSLSSPPAGYRIKCGKCGFMTIGWSASPGDPFDGPLFLDVVSARDYLHRNYGAYRSLQESIANRKATPLRKIEEGSLPTAPKEVRQ